MLTDREFNQLCQTLLATGAGKPRRIRENARQQPLTVDKLLVDLGLKAKPVPRKEMRLFLNALGVKQERWGDRLEREARLKQICE